MKRFPLTTLACVLTAALALGACSKQGSNGGSGASTTPSGTSGTGTSGTGTSGGGTSSAGSSSSMSPSGPASAASQ